MRRIFQQRNINSLSLSLSVLSASAPFARAENLQGRCQWAVSFSLLPTSRAASAEKSLPFERKEVRRERKKGKETLLIEGFSINVSCRKGIIFSARKRPLHLFSAIFLGPPPRPLVPLSSSRFVGVPSPLLPFLGSSGKSPRTYRHVFPAVFLLQVLAAVAAIVVGILLGIDNAQDAAGIRPSIIVEDKSVRRRIRDSGVSGWRGDRSRWRKTLAVAANGRRQSFIRSGGR